MGKSPDTFGPPGLAMVTADEIPDPQRLDLRTTVSGEVLQQASTKVISIDGVTELTNEVVGEAS